MHFDWTINLSNLVEGLGLIAAGVAAHINSVKVAEKRHTENLKRLEHIETRLDTIYEWFMSSVVKRRNED